MPKDTINAELAGLHQDAAGAYTAAIVTETAVPNTNARGKALRAQTAERVGKAGGLSLIALSLAACGGSSSSDETVEEPTVYTLSELIAAMDSDDVADDFEVDVQAGDIGTFTVAEVSALLETIEGAQNATAALTALDAAIAGGTVTWSIADSAANLLSFAGTFADVLASAASVSVTDSTLSLTVTNFETLADFDVTYVGDVTVSDTAAAILASDADFGDSAVTVTDAAVTLTVANFETLAELGATFTGDVTVSDTAEAILASDADFGDAEIAVTTLADPLTVAELGTLNALDATFATAPDVADTIENADGATIAGIGNLTLGVAGSTAGADDADATITASGTGTVTFNFADEDDTITLLAGSTFSGFTVLAVVAGTVDVRAADLGDIVDITVASKIVMTAAQFLALDSLDGLSDDAEIEIEIASAEEAAAVISAAEGIINAALRSEGMVILVPTEDADISDAELDNLQADLQAAFDAATTSDALPNALDALEASIDAIEAEAASLNVELAGFDALVTTPFATTFPTGIVVDLGVSATPLTVAVDGVLTQVATARDNGIVSAPNSVATLGKTDVQIAADVAAVRATLESAIDTASDDYDDAREALVEATDAVLVARYDQALAVEDAATAANTAAIAAETAAETAALAAALDGGTPIPAPVSGLSFDFTGGNLVVVDGTILPTPATVQIATLSQGVLQIVDASVTLSDNGSFYTVNVPTAPGGSITIPAAEFDALIAAVQESYDTGLALTDATDDVTAAVDAFGTPAPTELSDYDNAISTLSTAEDASEAFELAYDAWSLLDAAFVELSLLGVEAAALEADFVTALESIESVTNDDVPGLDVNVVGLGPTTTDTIGDSDVFLASLTPSGSSLNLDDVDFLRFDGSYTFVELGEDDVIGDNLGSASTLEIFAQQGLTGVDLYIENIATAGNGTSAITDITTITLTGVTLDNLSFDQDTSILTASSTIV
jgi:hypothetical protein